MTKKRMTVLLALCLVVVLGVGATLAYLTRTIEEVENKFTFASEGIDAELIEPEWDPEDAENLLPGAELPKDPQVVNTGELPIWTALQVTFVYNETIGEQVAGTQFSAVDYEKLFGLIEVDYEPENPVGGGWGGGGGTSLWARIGGTDAEDAQQVFYYTEILPVEDSEAPGEEVTVPLFTKVKIKDDVDAADMKWLNEIGGFTIDIRGFAVQAAGLGSYTDFEEWGMDDNVVFKTLVEVVEP